MCLLSARWRWCSSNGTLGNLEHGTCKGIQLKSGLHPVPVRSQVEANYSAPFRFVMVDTRDKGALSGVFGLKVLQGPAGACRGLKLPAFVKV